MRCDQLALQENDSLENAAWRSLANAYKTVYTHIDSDLRQYGLTPPQYAVLRIIGRSAKKSLPMSEISREMIATFANVTTIVDNLERRQCVRRVRETRDRRVVKVELTSEGLGLFTTIFAAHRRQIAKLMHGLTRSELQSLIDFTAKLRDTIVKRESSEL